ncbi:hypothetical protein CEUSTIGMA_g11889.t1 [Chlamydomonas eustigma]|uniref:THH1/TOM1/TOM3 domain-containing protein n=1 Tax=Chlamydomonas eustigma TaxID=1157962 RepID=A0A250XNE1_9CHLO|nr:hypothetical protein CEUSTIGMA_g11889.t1 [Chlamydomonas eustigma]|eukprot:GAX84469.1 hypothetical protein CEUSTIGMA_g11889.t1 [Chlamydomonas eustigma]
MSNQTPSHYRAYPPPRSEYGYQPSLAANIVGLSLFSMSTLLHCWQMIYYRMWWCVVLPIGGITEMIGYAARIYSYHSDSNNNAFLAQTVTLIIAPSFFSAALYIVFGKIIIAIGRKYSIMRPVTYIWVFCAADILSLVIQAIGGGIASQATIKENLSLSNLGTHIMVAGICWQMFSMAMFVILVILFIINVLNARLQLPHKLKVFCAGMALVTVMIFVRCIYRTIELLGGWEGYIITHEVYFITLEEVPMLIALLAFNVFHPGQYLKDIESLESFELPTTAKDVVSDSKIEISVAVKPSLANKEIA